MESGGRSGLGNGWVTVEARLQGGAPWGFTLQGGLEHGEPLFISKVEEGGKAEGLEQPLRVGDHIVVINQVELSGYRQEAIALVKGSHKTLQLTVRREFDAGYIEEFVPLPASFASLSPLPLSSQLPTPSLQQAPLAPNHSGPCSAVQLRIKSRRTEPASRPHSWHSTKLGDCQQELDQRPMDTMSSSSSWHHNCHSSASTIDLSGGFDSGGGYLRKSPDQYSSRGSMESLDPPLSSQLPSGTQQHHPLGHHGHSGPHPAYSSCHQLSSARSSNSIDHLHNKRDSAYSSFSTSSSIPEYLASMPSFSPERSYSLETVPQRGGGGAEMQPADLRYVQTVYDNQQGLSQRHELSSTSAALQHNSESRAGGAVRPAPNPDHQVSGVCCHGSCRSSSDGGAVASNRHSVGSLWGPATSCSFYGAPAPPRRSDSYTAIRNHDRPNSWSSLEHARSLRSLQKGSWHHSSGPVASGAGKGSYSTEGQLHTVIEKSPESSPTTKPRQGGGFLQPLSPTAGSTPQSSRTILPLSMYPDLQSEPHYAQILSTAPTPGPLRVYPGKESRQQEGGAAEGEMDGRSIPENGYSHSFHSTTDSTQRHQQEKSDCGPLSVQMKSAGGESEGQRRLPVPPSIQEPAPQSRGSQEQKQLLHIQLHAAPEPYTPVQSWEGTSRSGEQSSSHSEALPVCRPAHGPASVIQPSSCHLSDSAALQYQHWDPRNQDKEHPLTRLENALAEVQQCSSPNAVDSASSHDNSGFSESSRGPVRSLSVLEKVSRFERRDHAGKQRSQSTSTSFNKPTHLRMPEKGRSAPCGAEDLRHMLERSTRATKAHRTMSFRGSGEQAKHRILADPSSALQRSRSTFQVDASTDGGSSKDFPWRQEVQESLGPMQDMSSNSSYRNSLKDAQCSVLRSTSFRRMDLRSSVSDPPAAAPPAGGYSSSSQQPLPIPAKCQSLEKKGPKTMPKPQGVIITPQSLPPITSPHTPKERHVVSPEVRGPSPPALPTVPPVGPPALFRICGRKRLTADQKKRSYSEPENINEVGVSDAETAALFRRGGETSVADRRKMFELAVSRVGGSASRPDLRQVQQDALAEYVERKRAGRREEGGHRSGRRPHSAYLGPENSSHADSLSLSSTSSLLSLQDTCLDQSFSSGERRTFTPLQSEAEQQMLQSNLFYPGRVTTPRLPAHSSTGSPYSSSHEIHAYNQQALVPVFSRQSRSPSRHLSLSHDRQGAEVQPNIGRSKQANGALLRASSASADSLLEDSRISVQHQRSRSSPTAERLHQDLVLGDVRVFGVFISKPERCTLAADSPSDVHVRGSASPQPIHISGNSFQSAEPSPDPSSSQTPVPRRERQRTSERQRAQSTSTLAASVGLPCPFSPPGTTAGIGLEWQTSNNLDAITFPITGSGDGEDAGTAGYSETLVTGRQTGPSVLQDTTMDTSSLGTGRDHTAEKPCPGPGTQTQSSSSPSLSNPSPHQQLVSLRISESGFFPSTDQQQTLPMQEDYDDVFFQSPLLLKEQIITEDVLPPPPPPPMVFEQRMESVSSEPASLMRNPSLQSSPALSPSVLSSVPSIKPQVSIITSSKTTEEDLSLEYQPLSKREKTLEEQRVETLTQQLVLQDPSLASILDTWAGGSTGSTVEIMDQIFPNCKLTFKAQWQHRGSSHVDDSLQDGLCGAAQSEETDGARKTNVDEDQKDVNTRKVELCEALQSSMAALQLEKDALCEEQRRHQVLGASIEKLVQERLKPNERDKFSMFIGDLDKIVNLLLSLCGRLSRIDRALLNLQKGQLSVEEAAEEKESLDHKCSVLLRQTEDACELKENLDRRQRVVHGILSGYLTEPQLQDYRRFVCNKPSFLIRQRRLDDLLRQQEEQLVHLVESLPVEVAEAHGWSATARAFFGPAVPCPSPFPLPLPNPVTPGIVHSVRSTTVTSL